MVFKIEVGLAGGCEVDHVPAFFRINNPGVHIGQDREPEGVSVGLDGLAVLFFLSCVHVNSERPVSQACKFYKNTARNLCSVQKKRPAGRKTRKIGGKRAKSADNSAGQYAKVEKPETAKNHHVSSKGRRVADCKPTARPRWRKERWSQQDPREGACFFWRARRG